MKKITLLSFAFALVAGVLSAESVQVTTTDMNAETPGSLLYVIANAPEATETVIEFNFDGTELDYADGTGIAISKRKLIFDGVNKKNGEQVTIKGTLTLFKITDASEVTLNKIRITGFKGIAMTLAGGSTVTAEGCLFENNFELETTKKNNGGVMRINGSKGIIKNCLFKKNRGGGSYGGGAICVYGPAAELQVENSSFIENVATSGGAIGVNVTAGNASPKIYIANSTFANNLTDDRGGALYMQTATVVDIFAPVVVNCTFVGNINGNDGGAICAWSRATTSMKPVFINNLFAENYRKAWMVGQGEELNDVWAYYLGGELDNNGAVLAQTVFPTSKNNVYVSAPDKFFDASSKKVDFKNIFKATEKNPLDEGDDYFNHQSSKLEGDMMVAMIAENSVAKGAGIASFEGVEIPKKDQLGNARPATPSAGAVEYALVTGIMDNIANDSNIKVWNEGNLLFVSGIEDTASVSVYDLTGKEVYRGSIENNSSVSVTGVSEGVYIAKISNSSNLKAAKLVIK